MITFSQILDFLKKLDISFLQIGDTSKLDKSEHYCFASIKNTIEKGLYYLSKDIIWNASKITNSIIITDALEKDIAHDSNLYILVASPQLIHYKISSLFQKNYKPEIHKTAIVSPNAIVSSSAHIGPYCIIEDCVIGDKVSLVSNVTVRDKVKIGSGTVIEGNSVIGARGMAWIWDEKGERIIQPQMGGVIIEENCVIGTDITIVRGSLSENTRIGKGTIIAHGTKIGHGSQIEENVHMANNVSLAGNACIGQNTFLGSGCVISSNVKVAKNCIVGAGAVVTKNYGEEFLTLAGVPAVVIKTENYKDKPKGAPKPFNTI